MHKLLCSEYRAHTNRPGPAYQRAVVFAPQKKSPQLEWIEHEELFDDYTEVKWELSKLREHIGPGNPTPHRLQQQGNALRDRTLDHSIEIAWRDNFLADGSPRNQAIATATQGIAQYDWRGAVVGMRKKGTGLNPTTYEDMTLEDFRDMVDYLIMYGVETSEEADSIIHRRGGKVKGVKVHCDGDKKLHHRTKYLSIDVPKMHPAFREAISPISKLIEMPVRTRKYPVDRRWKDVFGATDNQAVTFLYLCADPNSQMWGWAPPQWQSQVGSVLVVRDDGKDLTPDEVEVLCNFCQFEMQPLFEDSLDDSYIPRTRQEVMGHMTKEKYAKYAAEFHLVDPEYLKAYLELNPHVAAQH